MKTYNKIKRIVLRFARANWLKLLFSAYIGICIIADEKDSIHFVFLGLVIYFVNNLKNR